MSFRAAKQRLGGCLLLLAALYLIWLMDGRYPAATLLVFVLPPVALSIAALCGWRRAGYWSSVLALGWFSHGVMRAWTDAPEVLPALGAIVLSLAIIAVGSGPAARARLAARRAARSTPSGS